MIIGAMLATVAIPLAFFAGAGAERQQWFKDAKGRDYYCYDKEKRECYWASGMRYDANNPTEPAVVPRPGVRPAGAAPVVSVQPSSLACTPDNKVAMEAWLRLPKLSDRTGPDEYITGATTRMVELDPRGQSAYGFAPLKLTISDMNHPEGAARELIALFREPYPTVVAALERQYGAPCTPGLLRGCVIRFKTITELKVETLRDGKTMVNCANDF